MSVAEEVIRPGTTRRFLRCSIKRLNIDMTYESDWQNISFFVVSYGSVSWGYNDEYSYGATQIDGTTLVLNNSSRTFNNEKDYSSIFNGFKTRYRTKFKIERGFIDEYGEESIVQLTWYGILYAEPENHADWSISLSIAPMIKVFENYTAYGLGTTSGTTADLVLRICQKTVNGSRIFDQFFEGASDAFKYKINESASIVTTISNPSFRADETCWKKIQDYCTYDNFVPYVDYLGAFVWQKRSESASTTWVFNGPGSFDNDYGVNIIALNYEIDGNAQVYTRVSIEYGDNTFSTQSVGWTPGDGSYPDTYGERTYSKQFYDLSAGNASTVASNVLTELKQPHRRWSISTVFIPHLQVNDRVEINYVGAVYPATGVFTLGVSVLGGADVLGQRSGSINLNGVAAKITGITLDLDNDTSTFLLQEI